jgi:hypothetical protein
MIEAWPPLYYYGDLHILLVSFIILMFFSFSPALWPFSAECFGCGLHPTCHSVVVENQRRVGGGLPFLPSSTTKIEGKRRREGGNQKGGMLDSFFSMRLLRAFFSCEKHLEQLQRELTARHEDTKKQCFAVVDDVFANVMVTVMRSSWKRERRERAPPSL